MDLWSFLHYAWNAAKHLPFSLLMARQCPQITHCIFSTIISHVQSSASLAMWEFIGPQTFLLMNRHVAYAGFHS